jgi:uncharacterized membrane protein
MIVNREDGIMKERLFSIDAVRGWVMVFMALDHAMLFCYHHIVAEGYQGIRPLLMPDALHYITRFITHYCAPTFIFLAGLSIALYAGRRSPQLSNTQITTKLVTRGLLLIILQLVIVNWIWGFGLEQQRIYGYGLVYFGVLACIGSGIIIFAFAHRLPLPALATGSMLLLLVIPFLLRWFPLVPGSDHVLLEIFLQPNNEGWLFVNYPVLPWLGVMGIGCACGLWIIENPGRVTRLFLIMGVVLLSAWVIVRLGGGYGNLVPYQGEGWRDFMLMSKYPPSLAFLLWNLGGMSLALAAHSHFKKHLTGTQFFKMIVLFGQVPLFFYVIHLYIYKWLSYIPILRGSLTMGYLAWVLGLLAMIPLCYGFRSVKKDHPRSILQYI